MAGAAMLRAVFLSGLKPEVYFFGQEYQTKGFVGDCVLDISDVFERKYELVRKYRCQYRDGGIERRHRAADTFYGMGTQMLAFGKAESFKSLYPRTQGERRIFDEIDPIPSLLGERKFQGARDELPPKLPSKTGYEAEIEYFFGMIEGRRQKRILTAKDARDSIALLVAERKSAISGKTVGF